MSPTGPGAPMTIERLRTILASYGASAERWPQEERGAMLALLNNSAEARRAREEACRLDLALDGLRPPAPSPGLAKQIAARPVLPRPHRERRTESRRFARIGALAASVLVGVMIGFGAGNYAFVPDTERQTAAMPPAADDVPDMSIATLHGPPTAPSIADPGPTGLGIPPMLAVGESAGDDPDLNEPVPLI